MSRLMHGEKTMTETTRHCWSCGEHHDKDVMCPPHEVRTTGQAWAKAHKDCERRRPDRAPWGMACTGCYGKGNPGQADVRLSGIEKNGMVIRVHVWAPNIASSNYCQGVPDRREPKREHVVRGPDRREVDAKQPVCWTCLLRGKRVEIENVTACSLRCPHQHESGQCAVHRAWVHKGDRRFADATHPEPGHEQCKR